MGLPTLNHLGWRENLQTRHQAFIELCGLLVVVVVLVGAGGGLLVQMKQQSAVPSTALGRSVCGLGVCAERLRRQSVDRTSETVQLFFGLWFRKRSNCTFANQKKSNFSSLE